MIQQINLYQDVLKLDQTKTVLNRFYFGLSTVVLFLLGFSLYLVSDLGSNRKMLQQAKQQLTEVEFQLQLVKIQYPKQQINLLLTQEISKSKNILNNLYTVIDILTDTESDQTQGFSRYFTALARQNIAEVWLSNIAVDGQNNTLRLKGRTYHAEKTPVFLQKLQNEPIFQGRNFAQLIMSQAEKDENMIDFTVSTTIEKQEKNKP